MSSEAMTVASLFEIFQNVSSALVHLLARLPLFRHAFYEISCVTRNETVESNMHVSMLWALTHGIFQMPPSIPRSLPLRTPLTLSALSRLEFASASVEHMSRGAFRGLAKLLEESVAFQWK